MVDKEDIIRMAREAGLYVAHDSEGHFSGVTNEEIIDMYQDQNKERDRLLREKIFMEVLAPFAEMVAAKEREECASVAESYEPTCDTCPSGVANAIRARREK
jgi:hypothetical protein